MKAYISPTLRCTVTLLSLQADSQVIFSLWLVASLKIPAPLPTANPQTRSQTRKIEHHRRKTTDGSAAGHRDATETEKDKVTDHVRKMQGSNGKISAGIAIVTETTVETETPDCREGTEITTAPDQGRAHDRDRARLLLASSTRQDGMIVTETEIEPETETETETEVERTSDHLMTETQKVRRTEPPEARKQRRRTRNQRLQRHPLQHNP